LLEDFALEGYGVYRTNIDFMSKVANLYGPVKAKVNRRIKQALDPNGILAPGKSGDLPDFFGPIISGKMALRKEGRADEKEPFHRRADRCHAA